MSFESYRSPVWPSLLMVAHLCGFQGTPTVFDAYGIIRQCVSIGKVGWGLALYALALILSGGEEPSYSVMPVPHASLGRIENLCVIGPMKLALKEAVAEEGFFTNIAEYVIPFESGEGEERNYKVEVPDVFAVCLTYRDIHNELNNRCFIIKHLKGKISSPFMSVIPSDITTEKLITVCMEGAELTVEETEELIRKYGKPLGKEGKEEGREPAEEGFPEGFTEEFNP